MKYAQSRKDIFTAFFLWQLDKDGLMTKEVFDSFVEKEVPASMRESATPILEKCRETVGKYSQQHQLTPMEHRTMSLTGGAVLTVSSQEIL